MSDASAAFYDRAAFDPQLQTLLGVKAGGAARLYPDWPPDPWTESDFPRATYFVAADVRVRPGYADVTIQVDVWVWPSGGNGGRTRIREIDDRLLELFHEQVWQHVGLRLYSQAGGARDFPSPPNEPLRRIRNYQVSVT